MVTNTQIIPVNDAILAVKTLCEIVRQLRGDVFQEGVDFGVIPGTGDKPTLLLPGMEKLLRALRLRPEYHPVSVTEDFEKGLFAYRYECRLIEVDTGLCVSTAIGSCNSKESKYRWREAKRRCPKCQKETINRSKYAPKGKPNDPPGWYCYAKAGGCGAEFAHDDPAITSQQVGRIENPDIFDSVNTIDKIAQKRALGSAIKGAANVSEYFTVDLEDLRTFDDVVEGQFTVVKPEAPSVEEKLANAIFEAALAEARTPPPNVDPETGEILGDERPWTPDEADVWVKEQLGRGHSTRELKAALGVKERWGEWTRGPRAASRALDAWIAAQQANGKVAEPAGK